MSARSVVWSVALNGESLLLSEVQQMHTHGAHGWDYFEAAGASGAEGFLVVPNYYGCQHERGPATGNCRSTHVFRWDKALRRFEEARRLRTAGPGQTDHLLLPDGRAFVVVGENFNDEVCIYQLRRAEGRAPSLEKVQALPVPGAGAIAVAHISGRAYLIATSYHDHRTGWATQTKVYSLREPSSAGQGGFEGFVETQVLKTRGCHDAEFETVGGIHFLFLSEDRDAETSVIDSQVFVFSEASQRFEPMQRIATDGAHAAELFEGPDGAPYLAVANFGDRLGQRYRAQSSVWRYAREAGRFRRVATVETFGATDWEHFVLDGRHFLAVSNEGDVAHNKFQVSQIYELLGDGPPGLATDRSAGPYDEL